MSNRFRKSRVRTALATVLLTLLAGCSKPPAVEHENLSLISMLRTALSAQRKDWLDGVERAVQQRWSAKTLDEAGHVQFQQIIDKAKSGDWKQAEQDCFAFEEAQLNRRRKSQSGGEFQRGATPAG